MQALERTALDLDLEVFSFLLTIVASTRERIRDTSGKVHMVVFQEDHIKQSDTMVHTSAKHDCFFLQVTQTRRGLTGIKYVAAGVLNEGLVFMRGGRHTRHALHDIEHRALDLQQAEFLTIYLEGYIARFDMIAIMQELLKAALGIKIVNDLFGYFHTGEYTGVLDDQLLTTHLGRRNTTERSVVTITDVLFKPDSNKLTKFLFVHSKNHFCAAKLQ